MRVPRLYLDEPLSSGSEKTLDARASHYLCTVLRLEQGRELILFNNTGYEYSAVLLTSHKKSAVIEVGPKTLIERESPLSTHLAVGISRGERFDLVLQKACELGVSAITPLFTERTEVRLKGERLQKKQEHWQQIIISAAEQCQRNRLPTLNSALEFKQFLNQSAHPSSDNSATAPLKLVLHHRSEQKLADYIRPASVTLLVGPEGGLSSDEIEAAETEGFNALTLGPRVLRTETAPIVALTCLQLLWGDF